jgi:hypothetical protein
LDSGYDYDDCREAAAVRGYTAHVLPKASAAMPLPPDQDQPDRHPPWRWVVEVVPSWGHRFRPLLMRTGKHARHYRGGCHLAAILIISRSSRKVRPARLRSGLRVRTASRGSVA